MELFCWLESLLEAIQQHQGTLLALSSICMLLLTAVYVVGTLQMSSAMKRSNLQAQAFETARSRPVVTLNIIPEKNGYSAVLENHGATPAYRVRVVLEPKLIPISRDTESMLTSSEIQLIVPRQTIKDAIGPADRIHTKYPNPVFRGKIAYQDVLGRGYSENIVLDLNLFYNLRYRESEFKTEVRNLAKKLDHIHDAMRQITDRWDE